jgi:hypothetical protein
MTTLINRRNYEIVQPISLSIDDLPATLPFDFNLIKLHCHITDAQTGGPFDAFLLDTYLRSAILWAEGQMHRTIVARAHRWTIQDFGFNWQDYFRITLPRGKCQSIQSIKYSQNHQIVTMLGASNSPPMSDFQQDISSDDGASIMPAVGAVWPVADIDVIAPVVITFTAGYSTFATIPTDIVQALFFYVCDCFELRGTTDLNAANYADVRMNKISPYILSRWY